MKKLSLYLMIVLLGVSILSCKKDEPTAKENLIGKWMMTALTVSPAQNGITDAFSTMVACLKDNLTIINADGTAQTDEGLLKCNAADPQTKNAGTWALSADEKTLTTTLTNGTQVMTIISLSSTTLVGRTTQVDSGGTFTFTVTLVKI